MSHPFGDLLSQHLHRKHGLSQSKLAAGILQDPSIIGKMCKGQRLSGAQARERVVAMIGWLHQQAALGTINEANQLLAAAGMAVLRKENPAEATLLQQLAIQPVHAPTPTPAMNHRTNLPAPLTSFVGRQQELREVAQRITDKRLVTLTGAGGVGKTRLALEVGKWIAAQSPGMTPAHPHTAVDASQFPDGIWFVDLVALADGSLSTTLVAQAIARPFKQVAQAGHTTLDALQNYLVDKHLLLVLDNCEHLVDACAEISERLLHHCWRLHILATSREELRIPGEEIYPVLPLTLPGPTANAPEQVLTCAAAQLFVDRMNARSPLLKIQDEEIATLAHICRQLDGIPLALELTAPLTRSMSLTEIATQLDNQMALLTNSYRTAIPRHQTMHSALIWSYRLLSPEEQRLLARVAVFAGGWTAAAAKAVCVDEPPATVTATNIVPLLNQLITKSLVLAESQNGERRYRLLEPVRQFAYTQLKARSEQGRIQHNHANYFIALAEKMAQVRDTPQEHEWLQRLEPERNNLRMVNRWAFEHNEAEFAQRFNSYLFAFWLYCSSMSEASQWLEGSLTIHEKRHEAEQTFDARMTKASTLNAAGFAAALSHDFDKAQTLFERELQLRIELDDPKGTANALRGISFVLMWGNKNINQALQYVEQALAICRAAQDEWGIAWSLFDIGYLALVYDDRAIAHAHFAEALPLFQKQGNNFGVFRTWLALGYLMQTVGELNQARRFYIDALSLQQQMHYVLNIADGLEWMAAIAATEQNPVQAVQLFGAAHAHRQSSALIRPYHLETAYEQAVALTRSQMSITAWNAAWATGYSLTLEQAVEYALGV